MSVLPAKPCHPEDMVCCPKTHCVDMSQETKNLSPLKTDMLAELDQRVADKVLERSNADLLRKLIIQADDDDEAIKIMSLGTTYKKTGLHYDKRLEKMDSTIRYFKKNERLSFRTDDTSPVHKLIIGDNYEALQNLLIQYKKGIDVIYIDPPYGKDNLGDFAKTNYENGITRDNLLSMLYPRLMLAKQLLSNQGIIYCSLDDKNQAYVKCLFDEIFGEANSIAVLPTIMNLKGNQDEFGFAGTHEYTLVYAKDIKQCSIKHFEVDEDDMANWDMDSIGYYKKGANLKSTGVNAPRSRRSNLYYPILINNRTLSVSTISEEEYLQCHTDDFDADDIAIEGIQQKYELQGYTVLLPITDGEKMSWRWQWSTVKDNSKEIIVTGEAGGFSIYKKQRPQLGDFPSKKPKTLFYKPQYSSGNGTSQHKEIFGGKIFDNPKPIELIKDLLYIGTDKQSFVLDFFAGSGTTGHAVLDLNERDGGQRTFILCQVNEITETTPNGIAYDCTTKRLKRIMTGECYDHSRNFVWAESNLPYGGNLDVYEIDRIQDHRPVDGKFPIEKIDETLYGKEKFKSLREKIDWVCNNFANAQKYVETDEEWTERIKEG